MKSVFLFILFLFIRTAFTVAQDSTHKNSQPLLTSLPRNAALYRFNYVDFNTFLNKCYSQAMAEMGYERNDLAADASKRSWKKVEQFIKNIKLDNIKQPNYVLEEKLVLKRRVFYRKLNFKIKLDFKYNNVKELNTYVVKQDIETIEKSPPKLKLEKGKIFTETTETVTRNINDINTTYYSVDYVVKFKVTISDKKYVYNKANEETLNNITFVDVFEGISTYK